MGSAGILASGAFDFVAKRGKFSLNFIAMVTLNFDGLIFNSATGATELFELLSQRRQFRFAARHTRDDGDGFASALFAIAHNAYDAIAFPLCRLAWLIAAAASVGLTAAWASGDAATIGGIDNAICHICFLSFTGSILAQRGISVMNYKAKNLKKCRGKMECLQNFIDFVIVSRSRTRYDMRKVYSYEWM
jgi:hypothetical protein